MFMEARNPEWFRIERKDFTTPFCSPFDKVDSSGDFFVWKEKYALLI
jgi:hypothetical protein